MKKINLCILMKKILPEKGINPYVKGKYPLIKASEQSKKRHNIPELAYKYGSGPPKFFFKTFLTLFSTIIQAHKSYKEAKNNPLNPKTKISDEFCQHLMEYAKSLGVLDIGFTKVLPQYIFKDSAILYEHAIILTIEMDKTAIDRAPSKETGHEVHQSYNKLGIIVNKMAEFIRVRGYGAQAGPAIGGDVNYVLLAEKAGLGTIGTHGLLISPHVGPRQRIAAVYTSIENLPEITTNEHLWIKDFCAQCKRCVKACPTKAIFAKPKNDHHDTFKHIDYIRCAIAFTKQYGCSLCIKECPFNKLDYYQIKDSFLP